MISKANFRLLPPSFPPHPILCHILHSGSSGSSHHTLNPHALHSYSITTGLISHPFFASRIIHLSLNTAADIHCTRSIFQTIPRPDVYTYNLMLSKTMDLSYYFHMRANGLPPNTYTFALLFRCSGRYDGTMAHGQAVKCGVDGVVVVNNCLMSMYCKMGMLFCARKVFDGMTDLDLVSYNTMVSTYGKVGDVGSAKEVFDSMPNRNLVSWTAMIDGYVRSGWCSEALMLFREMQAASEIEPDLVMSVGVLKACSQLGALEQGVWVHAFLNRKGISGNSNVVLATALVDMYCKCGCVESGMKVFNEFCGGRIGRGGGGDVVLWNAMINGLAMHGHGKEALDVFSEMENHGISPNEMTFIGVLSGCSHTGMVETGLNILESMRRNDGVKICREHYGCVVDLLGRAGMVEEAERLVLNMPMEAHATQWGALMSACTTHRKVDVGERVGRRLIDMEPADGGRYVSLWNVYMGAGKQEDAQETRNTMDDLGIKKETGCSLVECNGVVHQFIVGDTTHPCMPDVYQVLDLLDRSQIHGGTLSFTD